MADAIAIVAGLTAASGAWVAFTAWVERDRSADHLATRRNVDDLLAAARRRIAPRHTAKEAYEALSKGALIVDLRSNDDRRQRGVVPGSIHIPRSVLEWRVDPDCEFRNPAACDLEREVILMCADGFSSSFAALSLRELGYRRATDLVGGFSAWKADGLPVHPAPEPEAADELLGMGRPEPLADDNLDGATGVTAACQSCRAAPLLHSHHTGTHGRQNFGKRHLKVRIRRTAQADVTGRGGSP